MNIYLEAIGLKMATLCQVYSVKVFAFILGLQIQDYQFLINSLLVIAIILMVILLVVMAKNLSALKESALGNKEKGKVWINHKIYDFDAEQLKILIKKINKADKNDQQVETKN